MRSDKTTRTVLARCARFINRCADTVEKTFQDWLQAQAIHPLPFQQQAWQAAVDGKEGLIHAPTGRGKTLAAMAGALLRNYPPLRANAKPVTRVLWLTPLRALAADSERQIAEITRALRPDWRVGRRTGDTSASQRRKLLTQPPEVLVSTPESLSVLLSQPDARRQLRQLGHVIVDEWHELLASKRGVLLQLALAWLREANPELRTWGLSATLGNLDEAMQVLLGPERDGVRISDVAPRECIVEPVLPGDNTLDQPTRFPFAGHLGTHLLPRVLPLLDRAGSTLLFTNTRSQAELWHLAIVTSRPDLEDLVALHHGSLDKQARNEVEARLASGELRCVVATSSLDLGVDFQPVEQVIQIGSPKGIARLLQRAGRSGHRPDGRSHITCVPTHALELAEIAATRTALEKSTMESRRPPQLCLDVLAQHLVTLAAGGGFRPAEALAQARNTHAFAELTDQHWQWLLDFVHRGGQALNGYPQFRKVAPNEEGLWKTTTPTITRRHRMAIGTISSDSAMQVKFQRGQRLGTIEESFISRLRPGESFLFAGRLLELLRVRDMTAVVRRARKRSLQVPRWQGGRLPISTELAEHMLALFERVDAEDESLGELPEWPALAPVVTLQKQLTALPTRKRLLIEHIQLRDGEALYLFPFAGRLANEGLAALLAWRLGQQTPASLTVSANDYGLELHSSQPIDAGGIDWQALLSPEQLTEHVTAAINAMEMAKRQFRDIARIAGLIFTGYPGQGKGARQLQASSGLVFDVLSRFDEDNQLLGQAHREVLENQLELQRLREALQRMSEQTLALCQTEGLTPLAFPLWADRQAATLSTEDWKSRIQRIVAQRERDIST
jgi:ATP-dependent Lhr-like helicase